MLLGRHRLALAVQAREGAADALAGQAWRDDFVEEPPRGRHVRVGERVPELLDAGRAGHCRVLGALDLTLVEDVHRALRPHHRQFGRRPREVHVGPEMLARHDAVRSAVRLAGDDRDLGDRRLGIGIQQLRAVPDDAAELLDGARQEPRHVLEGHDRDVEGITEAHEARALHRRVDVEGARKVRRLVGDDADRPAAHAREPHEDVPGVVLLHLEEHALVDDRDNHLVHVVGLVRRLGHDGVEFRHLAIGRIGRRDDGGVVDVVRRQVREQFAHQRERRVVVVHREVRHAALRVVRHRAAEFLLGHLFVRDGADRRPGPSRTCSSCARPSR